MNNQQLINKLSACIAECLHCADACLDESDVKKMVPCIRLDRECAAVCEAGLKSVVQKSNLTKEIISLCEKACSACADECEKHEAQHCKDCAKACRECEEACRSYAA